MKTLELTISISDNGVSASRKCLIPAQYTYEELHRIIQLLFGLDNVEFYAFKLNKNTFIRAISSGPHDKPAATKLLRLKINDTFHYYYDILESFDFKIRVTDILDSKKNVPVVLNYRGKNLYEGILRGNFSAKRTAFDMKWCNNILKAFRGSAAETECRAEINTAFKKLLSIKNWQDYVYNCIYEIHSGQGRTFYIASNCMNDVIIDVYANADKLMQYVNMNINAMDYSAIRYHDTLTLDITRLDYREDRSSYDFSTNTYGATLTRCNVFNPHQILMIEELIYFTDIFNKMVTVIADIAAKPEIKLEKHVIIKNDGSYTIQPLALVTHPFGIDIDLDLDLIKGEDNYDTSDTIEIDVVSVYDEEARNANDFYPVLLLIADEENIEEMRLENCSLKTIAYNIIDMLLNRLLWHGPYEKIIVRDTNMSSILEPFATLGTEIVIEDHLEWLDDHVISTYFDDVFEDDGLSREMVVSQMKQAGLDEDMIHFYENMSDEEFEELNNHIDEIIDALEAEVDKPAIDYKKLS